jgi:hypothetical protein
MMSAPRPSTALRAVAAALCGFAAAISAHVPAASQGFSGTAVTHVRQFQLRPVMQDTVSRSRVTEGPDGLEFEGFPVVCITETGCVFYRSVPVQSAAYLTQDVELTAWGLGVRGMSASVLLRARTRLAGELSLLRADDGVDAVLAYVELNRERYRLRGGRQRTLSTLGATGFDGVAVLYDVTPRVRVEAFGGRSLGPGLAEPRHRALRGLDEIDFVRDVEAAVLGAEVAAEPRPGSSVALRYQREIWVDRVGLLSERAALTGRTAELRPVLLSGAADYDFAFGRIGRAHLRAQLPLPGERVVLEATVRRYVPYFELWTIWGFFNPVGYHEAVVQGGWTPTPAVALRASAGHRRYRETEASVFVRPLEDRSWRAELGGRWRVGERLTLDGGWTVDGPVGAFASSGDATLSYRAGDRLGMHLRGMAARQIEEFRLGHGTVIGAGGGVDLELRRDVQISGGVDVYRQTRTERPAAPDWNQVRSWLSVQVGFGRDPGMPREVAP